MQQELRSSGSKWREIRSSNSDLLYTCRRRQIFSDLSESGKLLNKVGKPLKKIGKAIEESWKTVEESGKLLKKVESRLGKIGFRVRKIEFPVRKIGLQEKEISILEREISIFPRDPLVSGDFRYLFFLRDWQHVCTRISVVELKYSQLKINHLNDTPSTKAAGGGIYSGAFDKDPKVPDQSRSRGRARWYLFFQHLF